MPYFDEESEVPQCRYKKCYNPEGVIPQQKVDSPPPPTFTPREPPDYSWLRKYDDSAPDDDHLASLNRWFSTWTSVTGGCWTPEEKRKVWDEHCRKVTSKRDWKENPKLWWYRRDIKNGQKAT